MNESIGGKEPQRVLLELAHRARLTRTQSELGFMLANDSRQLVPYRQAALFLNGQRLPVLSGVVQAEANAPYVLWLRKVLEHARSNFKPGQVFTAAQLSPELAAQWAQWWPAHGLWVPLGEQGDLLLADDLAWTQPQTALLGHWCETWAHAHQALGKSRWLGALPSKNGDGARRRIPWGWPALLVVLALAMAYPVQMTVLAPGELVPAQPTIVRAPMEGTVDAFHIQPNQRVRKGQPLFGFDEALIQSRLDVARQGLVTAQTDYRQTSQQALADPRARNQLGLLSGKIEEKRAEVQYLSDQLRRGRVLAPQDGVVLMDDPSEWIGRPVTVGERILRIAVEGDVEVEVWLPLADASSLQPGDPIQLFLHASPLEPLQAKLRYMAYEAVDRPEGYQAFRLRASLEHPTEQRVGLKGTAKIYGEKVPLIYWILRRPLTTARLYLGW